MTQKRSARTKKSEATVAFENQLNDLLGSAVRRRDPRSDIEQNTNEVLIATSAPLDMAGTEKLFNQYGTYLELIGGNAAVKQTRTFEFTAPEKKKY